jgi:hypothetical protein
MEFAELVFDGLGYGQSRTHIIDDQEPSIVKNILASLSYDYVMPNGDFQPMGWKRPIMALSPNQLHEKAPSLVDQINLPAGAPFGSVNIDIDNCTLCLACVGRAQPGL